mmetsp:Transcript_16739/g.26573  ORF Transcript_16739/g.26573 Transcript_16739/m.26573 type:complete len:275 (+) Transcript_16739:381-1205(+)
MMISPKLRPPPAALRITISRIHYRRQPYRVRAADLSFLAEARSNTNRSPRKKTVLSSSEVRTPQKRKPKWRRMARQMVRQMVRRMDLIFLGVKAEKPVLIQRRMGEPSDSSTPLQPNLQPHNRQNHLISLAKLPQPNLLILPPNPENSKASLWKRKNLCRRSRVWRPVAATGLGSWGLMLEVILVRVARGESRRVRMLMGLDFWTMTLRNLFLRPIPNLQTPTVLDLADLMDLPLLMRTKMKTKRTTMGAGSGSLTKPLLLLGKLRGILIHLQD